MKKLQDKIRVNIKDFSITPGARYKNESEYSGEEFRETVLEPAFKEALTENKKIVINLDGTLGYGTSWLEEVFGGLVRKYKDIPTAKFLEMFEFISNEEPYLIDEIREYIRDARNT